MVERQSEKYLKGSERQKADTLQAKIFNGCLRETKGKRYQKTFRKCSRPFSFNA